MSAGQRLAVYIHHGSLSAATTGAVTLRAELDQRGDLDTVG